MRKTKRVAKRCRGGAALAEYVLLVSLIAAVCVAAVTNFGSKVSSLFQDASGAIVSDDSQGKPDKDKPDKGKP